MSFDQTSTDAITSRALVNNFDQREKDRRDECRKNLDFYYDRGIQYVIRVNTDVEATVINLVRNITKKRTSLLYSDKLQREFDGPAESVKFLEDFYASMDIDEFLHATDLAAELTGTGLVHIKADEDSEYKVALQLINGENFSATCNLDDPNKADAISLIRTVDTYSEKSKSVSTVIQQQIWTENTVTLYETHNGRVPTLDDTKTHDLGFMPFVAFQGEDVDGQFVGHSPINSVRTMNQNVNSLLTHLAYTIKMQSFTPVALEGLDNSQSITIHPGKAINLPVGAKATVLKLAPEIKETLEAIKYIEEKTYDSASVPKVSIVGGEANSGREMLVKWYPIVQVFEDKALRFEKYELQLANTILRAVDLPLIDGIKVNYNSDKILPLSVAEDTLSDDIDMNIKTPIDEVMRRDPSLTEVEAQAIVDSNAVYNKGKGTPPVDPDDNDIPQEG